MAGQSGIVHTSAQLITPTAQAWLAKSQQARILHLFDQVCNLVNEHGDVLSVVSPVIDTGPFHVVLEEEFVPGDFPLSVDSAVSTAQDGVRLGLLWIDVSPAALWDPRLNWGELQAHTAVWQPRIPFIHTMMQQHRAQLGLGTAVWQPSLANGLQQVLMGIANQDTAVMQAGTAQLAGLGPGLTPAGDDVLLGVLYALWVTRPEAEVRVWADIIVDTAVPRTTTLSAAWLQAAGRGEAGAVWHDFGNGFSVNGNQWEETVVRILGTGHSSGADALWGFTAVTMMTEQMT